MSDLTPPNSERMYSVKVTNLDYDTTVEDLRQLFGICGRVGDVYIAKNPITNKSRGFGFIKYGKRADAVEAAFTLNGEVMKGRTIKVQPTDKKLRRKLAKRARRSRTSSSLSSDRYNRKYATLKIENLHYATTEDDIKELFHSCGPIADIYVPRIRNSGLNKGFAFIRFDRRYDAIFAIEHLNHRKLNGRVMKIVEAKYGKPPPNRHFKHASSPLALRHKRYR